MLITELLDIRLMAVEKHVMSWRNIGTQSSYDVKFRSRAEFYGLLLRKNK